MNKPHLHQKNYSLTESGWTLIEFSVSAALLLSIGVGMLDIGRIYQAKSAIRAGVDAALRCLGPAEGACIRDGSSQITQPVQYSYKKVEETPVLSVPLIQYHGKGTTSLVPTYELIKSAKVIRSISQPVIQSIKKEERTRFSNSTELRGFKREFVTLDGTNPRDPKFVTTNGAPFPPQVSLKVGSLLKDGESINVKVKIPTFRNNRSECILFSGPNDTPGPCGVFPWNPGTKMGNTEGGWNIPESQSFHELRDLTYGVIYITGSSSGTTIGTNGYAKLRISRDRPTKLINQTIDLGGQFIDGPMFNANFYPRGAHNDWISSNLANSDSLPDEMKQYQGIGLIPGETINLEFKLDKSSETKQNSSLQWYIDEVKIFLPKYRSMNKKVSCGATSACDDTCHLERFALSNTKRELVDRQTIYGVCTSDSTTTYNEAAYETTDPQYCTKSFYEIVDSETASLCESPKINRVECLERAIQYESAIMDSCRELSNSQIDIHRPYEVEYEDKLLTTNFTPNNCEDVTPKEPEEWKKIIGEFAYQTDKISEVPLILHCKNFETKSYELSNCVPDEENQLLGLYTLPQKQTAELPYDALRNEAIKCGMNPLAHLEVSFSLTGKSEQIPLNTPTTTLYNGTQTTEETLHDLGSYPFGEVPEICKSERCIKERILPPSEQNNTGSTNGALAEQVAKNMLSTYYPGAIFRSTCDEVDDCFEVKADLGAKPIRVNAKGNVKLFSPFFGRSSTPVAFSSYVYSEGKR